MINKTLQKELLAHFKKIADKRKCLDKIEKSLDLKDNSLQSFKEEIEGEITKKIKEWLDKKNFDYEKGRNCKGTRITFNNGKLKIRYFKHHHFYNFNVLENDELNEFLPEGLIEARKIIVEKLNEIEEVILEFKDKIKLKKGIPIQIIDSNRIERNLIKEIEISFNCEEEHSYYSGRRRSYSYGYGNNTYKSRDENFEVKLNGSSYDVDACLYSDEVFNNILLLIEKFKKHIQKIEGIKEKMKNNLRDFVFNQIDKMIILGGLEE